MYKAVGTAIAIVILSTGIARAEMKLGSDDMREGGQLAAEQVLNGFGCKGGNISPSLSWTGAPAGTRSFALTVYDPDAPTGSGWWHWTVFNIPPDVSALSQGASGTEKLPKGAIEGRTDFGEPGYGGACPPPGKPHRYVFTLHALKVDRLSIDDKASAAMLGFNLGANTLETAKLTVLYGR